ncbi:hypothetical protein EXIGLDRAFT_724313 [Exidia glandulosa HHB12029]|uniref:Uncharacterized protein n=1 Tax=Exidia glandulosa HHB12029 TaxID=1314781 RepID=A0A165MU70_EXIGL|nr:hypothetical protein EXIGLDRAFT_724313 [Exidia glandulosa HHB12029]
MISAGALDVFPHDATFFASVQEIEITDITDISILCSSTPVARMLAAVPRIILRSAPSVSTVELTWETCVRIFTVLGLHDQPHFPDRLDLYNIELKRPRWVLENGEMEERRFLLRMRMYDSQGNSVRSRSSV